MNAPLKYAKIHAVSPDKQKDVLTNIQDEENLWNILNYVYLYDFGSKYIELLLSKHGTNSKIQFKYNYKENFLQTQEKM